MERTRCFIYADFDFQDDADHAAGPCGYFILPQRLNRGSGSGGEDSPFRQWATNRQSEITRLFWAFSRRNCDRSRIAQQYETGYILKVQCS